MEYSGTQHLRDRSREKTEGREHSMKDKKAGGNDTQRSRRATDNTAGMSTTCVNWQCSVNDNFAVQTNATTCTPASTSTMTKTKTDRIDLPSFTQCSVAVINARRQNSHQYRSLSHMRTRSVKLANIPSLIRTLSVTHVTPHIQVHTKLSK